MKSFLFDLDGTLVLTDNIYLRVWSEILFPYNIIVTGDFFVTHIQGNNDENVVNKLIPSACLEDVSKQKNTLFDRHIHSVEPIVHSIDFLKQVKQKGHPVCVVTNCNRPNAEAIMKHVGLEKYILHLVIGNECIQAKPSPHPYLHAMTLLGTTPDQCYIFEDSKSGLLSAIQCAPYCVIGIETHTSEQTLLKYGANIVISDYSDAYLYKKLMKYKPCKNELDITKCIRNSLQYMNIDTIHVDDDTLLKGGYICDVCSVIITLCDKTSISCVFKRANTQQNNLSMMADKLGLYEREYYFYESIAPHVNINIPICYGIIRDDDFKQIGILLEDVSGKCDLNLNLNTSSIDVTLKLVDEIAKMHSYFHNKQLTTVFERLHKNDSTLFQPFWNEFIGERVGGFISKWDMVLNEKTAGIVRLISEKYTKIQQKLSTGGLTLCHGDFKSPNIFYAKDNTPTLIDWQYVVEGKGVQDIIFLMIESFESEHIHEWYSIIVNYYYKKRVEYGCTYARKDFDEDITYAICYFPTLVAIWFGTIDQDELLDKNFPYFFIKKYVYFLEHYVNVELLQHL